MVKSVPLTVPRQGGVDPFMRSQQLAAALEFAPPQADRPARSVAEGAVGGIGQGLRSFRAAQLAKSNRGAELQRNTAIANMLAPAQDGVETPERAALVNYLNSGGDPAIFGDAIAQKAGFGGPADAPTVQAWIDPATKEKGYRQWNGREWVAFGGTAPQSQPSETDKEIRALMAQGLSLADAQNVAYGVATVEPNQVTGEMSIVNKATGEARPVTYTDLPEGEPAPVPRETVTLWDQAEKATGLRPAAEALATDILPQLPGDWTGWPETIAARQDFATAGNEMIRALSVNPRFPVAEMQRIREEIAIHPSMFKAPESLKARMVSLDRSLRVRLANEGRAAGDRSLPRTTRQAALQSANAIKDFLGVMGVPEGASLDNLSEEAKSEELKALDEAIERKRREMGLPDG